MSFYAIASRFAVCFVATGFAVTCYGAETIALFNGKDLSSFYTFIKDRGRDVDPKAVFTVQDGMIRISGEEWGCITTNEEFEDYDLTVEFKWGGKTWGTREKATRDGGVLVHSVGEDGGYSGTWMHSIEVQIIEGGTGDFIVVGDKSDNYAITCPVAEEQQKGSYVYKPDGRRVTVNSGRVNWWGRSPEWEDVIGFRGDKDVEKPMGEWNTLQVHVKDGGIKVTLNGVVVNEAFDAKPSKGRIQIQSEGAEMLVRKVELTPLD
jgi:hypothetical protein